MHAVLSETENEILQVLIEKGPMQFKDLTDYFNNLGRGWKKQTLNTFLLRMLKKGKVKRELVGNTRLNTYTAIPYTNLEKLKTLNTIEEIAAFLHTQPKFCCEDEIRTWLGENN
jgi:predicted transcriptional regulator